MEEVLFYTPLLVEIDQIEIDDMVMMLSIWKDKYLSGWNLEVWNNLEALPQQQKLSSLKKILTLIRTSLKYVWPSLAISIVAYFSVWSALFLAVLLLPIQIILIIYLFFKLYSFICVFMAFTLDKERIL